MPDNPLLGPDWEKALEEMERLYAGTTDGEWAFKSVGEKCYATILGASPYYLMGPKARQCKEVEPPISTRGEVSDEFDEKRDEFNEVDFTDRIAESDEQRGGIDFGFAAVMHNQFPVVAAALRTLRARNAELEGQVGALVEVAWEAIWTSFKDLKDTTPRRLCVDCHAIFLSKQDAIQVNFHRDGCSVARQIASLDSSFSSAAARDERIRAEAKVEALRDIADETRRMMHVSRVKDERYVGWNEALLKIAAKAEAARREAGK